MSWADMRHDLHEYLPEMSKWDKVKTWVEFYWWPTRRGCLSHPARNLSSGKLDV